MSKYDKNLMLLNIAMLCYNNSSFGKNFLVFVFIVVAFPFVNRRLVHYVPPVTYDSPYLVCLPRHILPPFYLHIKPARACVVLLAVSTRCRIFWYVASGLFQLRSKEYLHLGKRFLSCAQIISQGTHMGKQMQVVERSSKISDHFFLIEKLNYLNTQVFCSGEISKLCLGRAGAGVWVPLQ